MLHRTPLLPLALLLCACSTTTLANQQSTIPAGPPEGSPRSTRIADDERPPPPLTPARPREIPLIEARVAASPLVTVRVVFESGSADDPTGREGLTAVLARLMTEGGTQALTYEELSRRLFPMAARISYHVDRDMTVFVGQVHRDHLTAFYPLLRDVLLRPRLAEDDFRRVRTQSTSDLTVDLRGSDDETLSREFLQTLIYAEHPYGHPALGTAAGLARLTLADVASHRGRVFCRERVMLGVAGGYPEGFAAQVRTDLAGLPGGCTAAAPLPAARRPEGVNVVIIDKPSARSSAIAIGWPLGITRAHPDFAAVQFTTDYLGLHRQSSGVLYQTIREARGLNYGDYAYAEYFEQEGGSRFPLANIQRRQQYASLWIRPVPAANAQFAIRAALRTVQTTLDRGFTDEAFGRTRSFLDAYASLYQQTESLHLGYLLDDAYTHATAPFVDRLRAARAPLTPASTIDVARRHMTSQNLWIAIVSPNAAALAEALRRNDPSPITYDSPKPAEVLAEDRQIQVFPLAVRPNSVRVVPLNDVFR